MLTSNIVPHPSTIINIQLHDEKTQLKVQAYTDYLNDLRKGMVPCLFENYFKDWEELRVLREYKAKSSRRVSN